jgi:hypothetical protein
MSSRIAKPTATFGRWPAGGGWAIRFILHTVSRKFREAMRRATHYGRAFGLIGGLGFSIACWAGLVALVS